MAKEYIERYAAIAALLAKLDECKHAEFLYGDEIDTIIRNITPADVVEVVRCRECKYREKDNFCTGRGWPKQLVADDGFCEKGKRKDGDGEC